MRILLALSALCLASMSFSAYAGQEDCGSGERWHDELGCIQPAVGSIRG